MLTHALAPVATGKEKKKRVFFLGFDPNELSSTGTLESSVEPLERSG